VFSSYFAYWNIFIHTNMCIYIILYIYLFYLCRFWTITLTFRNTNGWTYCLYLPHAIITKMYFSLLLHNWYPFTDMSIYKPVSFWYIHCTILNMSYFSCMFMLSWFRFVSIEHKIYSGTCLITGNMIFQQINRTIYCTIIA
jgi:hypothetical protein